MGDFFPAGGSNDTEQTYTDQDVTVGATGHTITNQSAGSLAFAPPASSDIHVAGTLINSGKVSVSIADSGSGSSLVFGDAAVYSTLTQTGGSISYHDTDTTSGGSSTVSLEYASIDNGAGSTIDIESVGALNVSADGRPLTFNYVGILNNAGSITVSGGPGSSLEWGNGPLQGGPDQNFTNSGTISFSNIRADLFYNSGENTGKILITNTDPKNTRFSFGGLNNNDGDFTNDSGGLIDISNTSGAPFSFDIRSLYNLSNSTIKVTNADLDTRLIENYYGVMDFKNSYIHVGAIGNNGVINMINSEITIDSVPRDSPGSMGGDGTYNLDHSTIVFNGSFQWGSPTLNLNNGGNILDLRNAMTIGPSSFGGKIRGFEAGDEIVLVASDSQWRSDLSINYNEAAGTLEVRFDGTLRCSYDVGPGYTGQFDYTGGTVTYSGPVPCFATGTLIGLASREEAVEALSLDDLVITASGEARRIAWLGRRVVDCSSHPEPATVWPFRIRAHAFGENRPARDLYLSPDHAVMVSCLSDVLIPIKHLDNGATVAQVPMENVTYWHVELENHDVLLAENLPAESFLDTRGKAFFGEAGFERSKADFATRAGRPRAELPRARTWEADACLPLVTEGPVVDAIRLQLLARAKALGWRQSDKVELEFRAERGGEDILVARLSETLFQLTLPARTGDIVLASRSFVPRHGDVATYDDRRLGVPLRRLEIQDIAAGRPPRRVALDDPGLTQGFHAIQDWQGERWRWTDGRGALSSALWAGARGMVRLEIELARGRGEMRAWVEPGDIIDGSVRMTAAV